MKLNAEGIQDVRSSYFGHIKVNINTVSAGVVIIYIYTKTIKGWGGSLNNPKNNPSPVLMYYRCIIKTIVLWHQTVL